MKSERSETLAITDALKRLAMARADVAISLESNGRSVFRYAAHPDTEDGRLQRLGAIMGASFGTMRWLSMPNARACACLVLRGCQRSIAAMRSANICL